MIKAGLLHVHQGDITKLGVDVIVNAANSTLSGGGGVDGAIHAAAGARLLGECAQIGDCPVGEVRITNGYNLPARHVIHAVGPVWEGGDHGEAELLAGCYANALLLAAEHDLESIAFPAISQGIFGYPPDKATEIAVKTIATELPSYPVIDQVIFCCFDAETADRHRAAIALFEA